MPEDSDLFLNWAAEEFVAAGRADGAALRDVHRRQAEFFADIFETLSRYPFRPPPKADEEEGEIGALLTRAFTR
ncbi:MAG TPA: hypothetical protein VJ859_08840 [Allosphingosinicella sp.]|nr:hypothetical protein [Allosphingosinicella sp.]